MTLTRRQTVRALRSCFNGAVRSSWMYRVDVVSGTLGLMLQVYLLSVVWRAVYASAERVRGITVSQAVSYAVLAICLQTVLMPWHFSSLIQRVRSGQVGLDMTRPVALIPQVLAQNLGTATAQLPLAIVALVWGITIGAVLPPSLMAVLPWVISTLLAVVLTLMVNLLVSLACFWSTELSGYLMLYRLGSGLLSGALVPLWFMPGWLAMVLDWLPFRAQVFTPLSIYSGQVSGTAAWLAIAAQLGWIFVVGTLLHVIWRRAEYRVVVLGG